MIKLPLRKHDGCDDMCGECCEWMERIKELTKPVTAEALKAFWNVVEAMLPQVAGGEVNEHSAELIREICEEEVMHFAVNNLPEPSIKVTPEGKKIRQRKRFEPVAVEAQPDAEWLPFRG